MPEVQQETIFLNGHEVFAGKTFELGTLNHSEEEIIEFARFVDPMPFHIDAEVAKKTIFGGIIASGSMLYMTAHKAWFIPMFAPSVVCGLGVRNWNFSKPHFPETPYVAKLTARELIFNPGRGTVQVEWYYTFHAADGTMVQDLELPVLHYNRG
jgi:acyl dehydratase